MHYKTPSSVRNKVDPNPALRTEELTHPHIIIAGKAQQMSSEIPPLRGNAGAVNAGIIIDDRLLIAAIKANDTKRVLAMLDAGANPNAMAEIGEKTALMIAANRNNMVIVKKLLKNGARIDAVDGFGYPASDYAWKAENTEVFEFLRDYKDQDARREKTEGLVRQINLMNTDWFKTVKNVDEFAADVAAFLPSFSQDVQDTVIELATKRQCSRFSLLLADKFPVTSEDHQLVLLKFVSAMVAPGMGSKFAERLGRNIGRRFNDISRETTERMDRLMAHNQCYALSRSIEAGRATSAEEF
jgi:ankyrin repeat protein